MTAAPLRVQVTKVVFPSVLSRTLSIQGGGLVVAAPGLVAGADLVYDPLPVRPGRLEAADGALGRQLRASTAARLSQSDEAAQAPLRIAHPPWHWSERPARVQAFHGCKACSLKMPRLLELFCGTKSVGRAFEAAGGRLPGHRVEI